MRLKEERKEWSRLEKRWLGLGSEPRVDDDSSDVGEGLSTINVPRQWLPKIKIKKVLLVRPGGAYLSDIAASASDSRINLSNKGGTSCLSGMSGPAYDELDYVSEAEATIEEGVDNVSTCCELSDDSDGYVSSNTAEDGSPSIAKREEAVDCHTW